MFFITTGVSHKNDQKLGLPAKNGDSIHKQKVPGSKYGSKYGQDCAVSPVTEICPLRVLGPRPSAGQGF